MLRSLGPQVVAVPGNHDIPHTFPARFTKPWDEFERLWRTTEPVHAADGICVVGLNSVRPWRHQSGGVGPAQLARATERLAAAPAGALRVVAMHHQMIGAPWRTRKRPVARRNHVLAALLDAGAELILSGHTHQGAVAERHEFEAWSPEQRGVMVSTAPGLGQPRPRRLGRSARDRPLRRRARGAACEHLRLARRRMGPDGGPPLPPRSRSGDLAEGETGADRERDRGKHPARRRGPVRVPGTRTGPEGPTPHRAPAATSPCPEHRTRGRDAPRGLPDRSGPSGRGRRRPRSAQSRADRAGSA